MKKYGAIIYSNSFNVGDEIQTLAAMKLVPHVDYFLDRESLNKKIASEKIHAICNGWFMHKPQHWPPAQNINPLFISFHAVHNANFQSPLVTAEHVAYFKKFEPVGCRDHGTVEVFKKAGIDAWFSGCLTLTLKNNFSHRNENIYCVDPFANLSPELRKRCRQIFFPPPLQKRLIFRSHYMDYADLNIQQKLQLAQQYIDDYAQAKLVVTSRIHCALPCLALGTPVIFIDIGYKGFKNRNRFSGLLELMNTISEDVYPYYSSSYANRLLRVISLDKILFDRKKVDIDWDHPKLNPVNVSSMSEQMRKRVSDFVNS